MNPLVALLPFALIVGMLGWVLAVRARRGRDAAGREAAIAARDLLLTRCDDAVVVLDPVGRVVEHNAAAGVLFGPLDEGRTAPTGGRFADRYPWLVALGPAEHGGGRADAEPRTWRADGRTYAVRTTPLEDPKGRDIGSVLRMRDVTRDVEVDALLQSMAVTDDVTGVPNRRHFCETARRDLEHASRYTRPVSLLAFDLDGFDGVVARYGHEIAEALLRAVAATVVADLRAADAVGRIGGASFAVLLPETGTVEAAKVAERVRHEVARIEVPAAGDVVSVTASIGSCSIGLGGPHDLEHMLACAGEALAAARVQGGDTCVAHPGTWIDAAYGPALRAV